MDPATASVVSGATQAGASLWGTGLNIWAQIYGLKEQRKEGRRVERKQEEYFERGVELEAGERREARMFEREENQASRTYKQRMLFLENMLANLNSSSTASANLQKLLRGRR